MAHRSDPPLLVLLGLRLKGFGPADALAEVTGLHDGEIAEHLGTFARHRWAVHREGRMTGWSLTPEGRAEGEKRLADELDRLGVRPHVEASYGRFVELNGAMLEVCTAWQVREGNTLNDHSDPAYDAEVIDRLGAIHTDVVPVCHELSDAIHRFTVYPARLEHAVQRVRVGEVDWFTGVRIPSYHTVWFELHEHLLATLGIDRAREGQL